MPRAKPVEHLALSGRRLLPPTTMYIAGYAKTSDIDANHIGGTIWL